MRLYFHSLHSRGGYFSRFPQPCSSCGALSIGVSYLTFSAFSLQPRVQLQLSTPFLDRTLAVSGICSFLTFFLTMFPWGSEASMFSEISPQPGARYGSPRQFLPGWYQGLVLRPIPAWVSSHATAMALQALLYHEGCAVPTVTLAERVFPNSFMIKVDRWLHWGLCSSHGDFLCHALAERVVFVRDQVDRCMVFLSTTAKLWKVPYRTWSICSIPLGTLTVLHIVDGAMVVVGCIEGCAVQTVSRTRDSKFVLCSG